MTTPGFPWACQEVSAGLGRLRVSPRWLGFPGRSYGLQARAFLHRGRGRGGRISAGSAICPILRVSAYGGLLSAREANRVLCGFFYDGIDHEKILGVLVCFSRAFGTGPGDIHDSARVHRQFNRKYNSGFENQSIGLDRARIIQAALPTDIHRIGRNNRMVAKSLDRSIFGEKDFTCVSAVIEQHLGSPPDFSNYEIDREVIPSNHEAVIATGNAEIAKGWGSIEFPSFKKQELGVALRAQEVAGGGEVALGGALVVHE